MHLLRSDRVAAGLLLVAAALGLVVAATPLGVPFREARDIELPLPGLHLTAEGLVSDGLLALFFLLIAIELRHELTHGDLASPSRSVPPAIAALGGVVAPAAVYLLLARDHPEGWPIPTATDIAFALGLLAVLGSRLPARVRAFLLALAVIDDLVAILLIAIVFQHGFTAGWLLASAVGAAAFWAATRIPDRRATLRTVTLTAMGVITWYCLALSGVHATLAGVALGVLLPATLAHRVDVVLQPVSRGFILPLFAFTASLVPVAELLSDRLSPVFWGIAVGLPVGKIVGVTVLGLAAGRMLGRASPRLPLAELVTVGSVSGVGFTVSLLMAQLAFGDRSALASQAVLGVLAGSAAAIVLSLVVVPLVARGAAGRRTTD